MGHNYYIYQKKTRYLTIETEYLLDLYTKYRQEESSLYQEDVMTIVIKPTNFTFWKHMAKSFAFIFTW